MYKFQLKPDELNKEECQGFLLQSTCTVFRQQTKKLSLQYYLEYRSYLAEEGKLEMLYGEGLTTVLRCCFFLGSQLEATSNVKGQKIRGVTVGLPQIIKSTPNLQLFMYHLKQIVRTVSLEDEDLQEYIVNFTAKFGFSLTFYRKFDDVIRQLDPIQAKCSPSNYTRLLINFGWLLFIDSKLRLFGSNSDIVEITCLLINVIKFFTISTVQFQKYRRFSLIPKGTKLKDYKDACTRAILQIFNLRQVTIFQKIESRFYGYLSSVVVDRYQNESLDEILAPQFIVSSYKKLDSLYQKVSSNPQDIDQRFFIKQRTVLSPSRFTPFGGKVAMTVGRKKQALNSQKIINYEIDEAAMKPEDKESSTNQPLMGKMFAPTASYKPFPSNSTPMSQVMQMYNWVAEKPNRMKVEQRYQELLQRIISLQKRAPDTKSRQGRKSLMWNLYCDCCSVYGIEDVSLLFWATQTVYSILNFRQIHFTRTAKMLGLSWYQIWKVADFYLKYDKSMPLSIKVHALEIETRIASFELWVQIPQLVSIFDASSKSSDSKSYPDSERLLRRVLHQTAFQIHLISDQLRLSEHAINAIFGTMQHLLSCHSSLLKHRHLDQLILCSVYSISKVLSLNLKFNQIITKYKDATKYEKQQYSQIIEQVVTHQKKEDIIGFYNSAFIAAMKPYLQKLKTQHNLEPDRQDLDGLISTPIQDLIPQEISSGRLNHHSQILLAYDQSPLLRGSSIKSLGASTKRLLNYQQFTSKERTAVKTKAEQLNNQIQQDPNEGSRPDCPSLKRVVSAKQIMASPTSRQSQKPRVKNEAKLSHKK